LVSGAIAESESGGSVFRRPAGTCAHSGKIDCSSLLHCWKQNLSGKQPRAEDTNAYRLFRASRVGMYIDLAELVRTFRVSDQDSHERLIAFSGDQFVSIGCVLDWKSMSDESIENDLAVGEQLEKRFHVPRLGPAYVRDGIVSSAFFVLRVVSSGAIGSRDAEI